MSKFKLKIEKPQKGGPGNKNGILDPLPSYHYSCIFSFPGGEISVYRYPPSQKSLLEGIGVRAEGSYLPTPDDLERRFKVNRAYHSIGEWEFYIRLGKFSLSWQSDFIHLMNIEFKIAKPLWISPSGKIAIQSYRYRRAFSIERLASKRLLKQLGSVA